ncbi:MAG: ABC transporter ATP-binding protein [Planctomycetota bacterium]|nr:ABC transporter ATP-binding protein [Planctomycetota bacterium]MDA1261907.1 ABC transporter ATP-binding protein [Planctomycetota bacterium]
MTNLRLSNIRKAFGQTLVVEDVTIEVPSGSLFFLLGSSGCGKTTILRMIAGFLQPTAGRVFFDDRDVTGLPAEKRNTGMVFQNYALWPHMTVSQNIGFGLDVRGMPSTEKKKRIGESLELVRMSQYADRLPNQLSGGQQQRVALARAIAFRPDLLLLDEPLSNLDAKLRLEMRSEIRRISHELRITMIYVTHDQHEALSLADQIAVMTAGKIEQIGSPRDVYQRPRTRFVAEFIGDTNFLSGDIQEARSTSGFAQVITPIASMRALVPSTKKIGDRVTLSIRPEAITIDEANAATHSQSNSTIILGKCIESTYLGSYAQHTVEVNGQKIKVFEMNPHSTPFVGKQVRLTIAADQVVGVEE